MAFEFQEFRSTITRVNDRRAIVLTFRGPNKRSAPIKISLVVVQELDPKNTRWPCAFHYCEGSIARPYAVIVVVAGPGVQVVIEGFPPQQYTLSFDVPEIRVVRLQDPHAVPDGVAELAANLPLMVGTYEINTGENALDSIFWRPDGGSYVPASASSRPFILRIGEDDAAFIHPYSSSRVVAKVTRFTTNPRELESARQRFAYYFDAEGELGSDSRPLLRIVATRDVEVRLVRPAHVTNRAYYYDQVERSGYLFASLYRVDDIKDVPPQGAVIDHAAWRSKQVPMDVELADADSAALDVLDVGLSFIPLVGQIIDVWEFRGAVKTGQDKWGRPV